MKATVHDSPPRFLCSGTTRKKFHSAKILGVALSVGTAGWGWLYQTGQANATNKTMAPDSLVSSHLKLEGDYLSEQKLEKPQLKEKTTLTKIRHLQNQSQVQAVNWANKSTRLLKQQEVMLQNLQQKREQLNISLKKLNAKNSAIAHKTILQPVANERESLVMETASIRAIPQLPALTAPQTRPDHNQQIYQVRAGDTLEIIARRYNTTREQLIEANKLKNPDLIFVAQQLKIPVSESGKSWSNDNNSNISLSSLSENRKSSQLQAIEISLGRDETSQSEQKTTTTSQPLDRVNSWLESATELYTTKLRAEIIELREQYRERIKGQTASIEFVNYETTASSSPVQARNDSSSLKRVAPSENFLPQLPTLPQLPNLKTSKPASAVTEFDSSRSISANVDSSKTRDSLVSTAPSSVENYNQMFRIPVGESVTPELPPLSSPDRYLPSGSSSQFDGYIWPSVGVISSGYGWRWGRMHRGIDIAGPIGTPIVAAAAGEVVFAGWSSGGYGNLVEVKHGDGSVTLYAHNNKILVRRGQWVEQGEQIAEMGSTGYSTGPHLHFEIRPDGQTTVNPIAFLPKN